MRRDKVATRILLILSVVHVAAAAPTIILQRSVEVTKDMTPGLEKRANSDDESSHPLPRMDNSLPSTSGTLASQDDTSASPGEPELHSDHPPELGSPQLHLDQPPTWGTPQLQDDLPPTPGGPPSLDDPLGASGTPQLHNDQPPAPPAPPPLPDDTLPGSGTLQLQDETSPAPGDPQFHSDPSQELGTPQLHIDQPQRSGTPQLQDDLPPTPGALPSQEDPLVESGTPQLHNDQSLTPGAPPSQDDTLSASEDPRLPDDPWRQHTNWSPPGEVLQGESSRTAEIPPLHYYLSWLNTIANWQPVEEMPTGESFPWWQYDLLQHYADSPPPEPMLQGGLSEAPPEFDDWGWPNANWDSTGETLYEGSSETSSTVTGAPELQNDLPPALGSPQVHDDPPPVLGTPQLHDGGSEELDYLNR